MENYLLLLFLCLGTNTIAQQKQVWVVGQDGEFLIGANVVALKDGQFVKGISTSQEGDFIFDESQWDQLKISYIGYEELLLSKEEVMVDDFILLPLATNNLAQIEVFFNKVYSLTNSFFLKLTNLSSHMHKKHRNISRRNTTDTTCLPDGTRL